MVLGTKTVIVRDRTEKRVCIVSQGAPGVFVELCRVIREIHAAAAIESVSLPFCSSAVIREGRAICFVGGDGPGKAAALLAAATGHFDDLSIIVGNGAILYSGEELSVLARSSIVSAGTDTPLTSDAERVTSPDLQHRHCGVAYLLLDLPLIKTLSPARGASVPSQIKLLPEGMCRALGISLASEGRVVALIESELAPDEPHSRLELIMDDEERKRLVRRSTLTDWVDDPDWLGLLVPRGGVLEDMSSCVPHVPDDVVVAKFRVGSDGEDVMRGLVAVLTSVKNPDEVGVLIADDPLPTYHFGVYARIVRDGALLCVKKTRGPYSGQLDLPGGRPELAESWDSALRRELAEEVAADSVAIGDFSRFTLHVESSAAGETINFHHHGAVAEVRLRGALPDAARSSADTNGWEWFDLRYGDRSRLSPLARSVLDK
ncbi:NUDIX domain [Actinomyces howellii]|uniref:NUDIX domain n=2 Tax=Actinomyces howellii TaxID=52771 RepID=A0A448HFR5_9ACTO|nr:NUDIX domain [Actinomyces howellii]